MLVRRRYECKFNFSFRAKEATPMKVDERRLDCRRCWIRPWKNDSEAESTPRSHPFDPTSGAYVSDSRVLSFKLFRCPSEDREFQRDLSLGKIYDYGEQLFLRPIRAHVSLLNESLLSVLCPSPASRKHDGPIQDERLLAFKSCRRMY